MSLLLLLRGEGGGEPEPPAPVLAARVVSQPVDDQLVVTLTHSSGRKSRWGGDEPDASGIPQAIATKTSAPGGHQDAGMSLVRDPRLDWPDMRLVDHVEITGNTRPLGRSAFEGQMDAFPAELAAGYAIGAEAIGYQCMLADDESWNEVYIDRDLGRWTGPGAQRQLNLINASAPHQGDASSSWDTGLNAPALVLAVNGAWANPPLPRCEAWYDAGPGNTIAHISAFFSGWADTAFQLMALVSDDAVATTQEGSADLFTAATGAFDFAPRARYRYGRVQWFYNAAGGTDGATYAVKLHGMVVIGDHGLTLRADRNGIAGYYGHDVIAHMLSTGAPGLNYRVGYDGTIIPETDWVLQQLAFHDQGRLAEALNVVNAHYLRNWAVWDCREFHWHPWRPDQRVVWRVRVAGGAHWSPAGPDGESLVNGVIVSFRDQAGTTRTAGPPGSGCDTESALLQDDRQENPYNQWGRRRWAKLDLPFPTTGGATGGAVQIGYVWLQDQMRPQRSGTLVVRPLGDGHVPQIEHPTAGPMPVWALRAGDFVDLVGYPEAEPFRVISTDYQHESRTVSCQLDNTPRFASALLERVGVRTGTLGI